MKDAPWINFPWGEIVQVHSIGDFDIVEHIDHAYNKIMFHIYIDNKDSHRSTGDLECAILLAFAHKYDGPNSQFGEFAARMLGLDEDTP